MEYDTKKLTLTIIILFAFLFFPPTSLARNVNPKCCNYPTNPGGVKIQFFLEACAVPGETAKGLIPYFDCQSYVLGLTDMYRLLKTSTPKNKQICIPENFTTKHLLDLIWKTYPNWEIPDNRQPAELIFEILRIEFPCENPIQE